ncbi:MAG: alkaline phosphatase family protein [Bifidobacteriaceae bacterium]|jgi:predicted AlkP superfamily pyrophosphatase or phosphodiesterase|nr:alkaline phosphatase family protein [Bifidobacteriaceae bacterium]
MTYSLLDILPATIGALGKNIKINDGTYTSYLQQKLKLPKINKAIIILCDGLGYYNLSKAIAYVPFLREHFEKCLLGKTILPSTTACALTSFAFSLPPGKTGIMGYKQLNPQTQKVINFLNATNLDKAPPFAYSKNQKYKTNFELAEEADCKTASIMEDSFKNSFLTNLYCKGSDIYATNNTQTKIDLSLQLIEKYNLVYLYYSNIDKMGHKHGVFSEYWYIALSELDLYLRKIYQKIPHNSLLLLTADHGMINKNPYTQYDIAKIPQLIDNIKAIGGEPRFIHLYLSNTSKLDKTLATWQNFWQDKVKIITKQQAINQKLLGSINPQYYSSIGDLIVICQSFTSILDSRIPKPNAKLMIGLHGSNSKEEQTIPIFPIIKN